MTDSTQHEKELAEWLEEISDSYWIEHESGEANVFKNHWLLLARKIREREDENVNLLLAKLCLWYGNEFEIDQSITPFRLAGKCRQLQSHFFRQPVQKGTRKASVAHSDGDVGMTSCSSDDELQCSEGESRTEIGDASKSSESNSASEATFNSETNNEFEMWWSNVWNKSEGKLAKRTVGFWKEKCRQAWHEGKKVKK